MKQYELPVVRPISKPMVSQAWYKSVRDWFTYKREWELMEDYVFYCPNLKKEMKVGKGFITDFASIPRILSVIPGMSPVGILLAGSVPHDCIYRRGYLLNINGRKHSVLSRKLADQILRDVTIQETKHTSTAKLAYRGVRMFGGSSFKSH